MKYLMTNFQRSVRTAGILIFIAATAAAAPERPRVEKIDKPVRLLVLRDPCRREKWREHGPAGRALLRDPDSGEGGGERIFGHDSIHLIKKLPEELWRIELEDYAEAARLRGQIEEIEKLEGVLGVWIEKTYRFDPGTEDRAQEEYHLGRLSAGSEAHDPLWEEQWGPGLCGVEGAWEITRGSPEVIVAIIDTGCDMTHPDLAGQIWRNESELTGREGVDDDGNGYRDDIRGYDFVSVGEGEVFSGEDPGPPDNDPEDFAGHGTHVSGIVGAAAGNGWGVEGVSPRCRLMILRAGYLAADGRGELREGDLIEALFYAVNMGASVINLSCGGEFSALLYEAILLAEEAGVVVVASAGNGGGEEKTYPAAYRETIAVAALEETLRPAVFTGRGDWVDCVAPGVSIISSLPGGYGYRSGTSAAAPFVSGCAALVKSRNPEWNAAQVRSQVLNTCQDIFAGEKPEEVLYGRGLCRADSAVRAIPALQIAAYGFDIRDTEGDGDRVAEAGEKVTVAFRLKNEWAEITEADLVVATEDRYVDLLDDGGRYVERLKAGEELPVEINFKCSSAMESDHLSWFRVELRRGGLLGFQRFALLLNGRRRLEPGEVRVMEISGDGDGGADPGERIKVMTRIVNRGARTAGVTASLETERTGLADGPPRYYVGDMEEGEKAWAEFEFTLNEVEREGRVIVPLRISGGDFSAEEEISLWIAYRGSGDAGGDPLMLQGDAGHGGFFREAPAGPLERRWEGVLEGQGSLLCQPVAAGGVVLVAREEAGSNTVYALETGSGRLEWRKSLSGQSPGGPSSLAWYRGILYVGGGENLQALDVAEGEVVWRWDPGAAEGEESVRVGNPAVYRERLLVAVHDRSPGGGDYICSLDPYTGFPEWRNDCPEGGYYAADAPACLEGKVFIADGAGWITAREVDSGEIVWHEEAGGTPGAPLIAFGGTVCAVTTEGFCRALSAGDGNLRWETNLGGKVSVPLCVNGEGSRLYLSVERFPGSEILVLEKAGGMIVDRWKMEKRISGISLSEYAVFATAVSGELFLIPIAGEAGEGDCHEPPPGPYPLSAAPAFHGGGLTFIAYNGNEEDLVAAYQTVERQTARGAARLRANFPNPFNPTTEILFEVSERRRVRLSVHDVTGRLLKVLEDGIFPPGSYRSEWNGRNQGGRKMAAGVYFCVLTTREGKESRKMVLIK
ncbi:MAG: S8 family serine peptidase [Candidatus Krumholzibacteriota bacterium]|nr:S8 family serine peptidase [Candidatus Krumholzibacteriota bacterium]